MDAFQILLQYAVQYQEKQQFDCSRIEAKSWRACNNNESEVRHTDRRETPASGILNEYLNDVFKIALECFHDTCNVKTSVDFYLPHTLEYDG